MGTASSSSQPVSSADGEIASLGRTTDPEAAADGSLIAVLKRLRTLLGGGGGTPATFPIRIKNGDLAGELNVGQFGAFDDLSYAWYAAVVLSYNMGYAGGNVWDRIRAAKVHKNLPRTALGAGATATVWTPTTGRAPRVLWFSVTVSAATVVTVKIGTRVIWERDLAGAGGADVLLPTNGTIGVANDLVTITTTAAVTVGASASGTEE